MRPSEQIQSPGVLARGDEIEILIVTSPACHLCEQAKDVLERLSGDYPLTWREVDMASPEGSDIVRSSRAPFPPMIVVGGQLYGYGRLSEKKLRKDLDHIMRET
ncbi:MAG: glutaredoxin [Acidimicrobiia bacterium]|nr:glutaredoxin family protein [Acidimicrobiia bacterium]NNK49734.1 glutaredoxin [Gemmatimonadota bacterium]NNL98049.1 glutaredoxin [Acidimicrobiia bacterium]